MHASAWLDRLNTLAPAFTDAALRGALVLLLAVVVTQLMRRRNGRRGDTWSGSVRSSCSLRCRCSRSGGPQ